MSMLKRSVGGTGGSRSAVLAAAAAAACVAATSSTTVAAASAPSNPSFGVRASLGPALGAGRALESLRGGGESAHVHGEGGGSSPSGTADAAAAGAAEQVDGCDKADASTVRGGAVGAEKTRKRKPKKGKKKTRSGGSTERPSSSASAGREGEQSTGGDGSKDDAATTVKAGGTEQTTPEAGAGDSTSVDSNETPGVPRTSGPASAPASAAGDAPKQRSKAKKKRESKPNPPPKPEEDETIRTILSASDYYEILGIAKSATTAEITKAYRRRAVRTHPDKLPTGDRTAFDKVAKAYDTLADEAKRGLYDRFGEAGVEAGGNPHGMGGFNFGGMGGAGSFAAQDVFRSFFGSSAPGAGGPFQPRNRNVRYQLEVTLEDLYNGLTRSVTISQPGLDPSSASAWMKRKTVEVSIPRGMASGESVVLPGEIDHVRGSAPADVVFVLAQRPHPVFSRRGHDLAMEVTLSLREALCGFERSFVHLDGRTIVIGPPRSSGKRRGARDRTEDKQEGQPPVIIRSGDVHVLRGEGMPKPSRSGGGFGDVYVQYTVEMPEADISTATALSSQEREELGRLLDKLEGNGGKKSSVKKEGKGTAGQRTADGGEIRYMEEASVSDYGRASGMFDHYDHGEEHLHREEDGERAGANFSGFSGGRSGGFHFFSSQGMGHGQECQQM